MALANAVSCAEQRRLLRAVLSDGDRHLLQASARAADAWQMLAGVLEEADAEEPEHAAGRAVVDSLVSVVDSGGDADDEAAQGAAALAALAGGGAARRARAALGDVAAAERLWS